MKRSDEKRSDEKRPDEKRPDEKRPDEKRSDEKRSDEKRPDRKKLNLKGLKQTGFDKRKMLGVSLALAAALAMGGCGSKYNGIASDMAAPEAYAPQANAGGAGMQNGYAAMEYDSYSSMEPAAVAEEMGGVDSGYTYKDNGSGAAAANTERKLIRTVDLNVETKEFDMVMGVLSDQVKELDGYIENMGTYNGSIYSGYRSSRSASLTIRIPKNRLDGFLETVSDISNVVSRSESVEDVTLTYVDMESHRNALKVEQERLLALLGQAESIEDILTIESRLSTVRYQLESMESQLRTFDNLVDYSTVYMNISEVKELTPVEEKSGWQRMAEGFADSIKDIGSGFKEFGIWFVVHIPYLVIWALAIGCMALAVRAFVRRTRKKRAGKQEEIKQE